MISPEYIAENIDNRIPTLTQERVLVSIPFPELTPRKGILPEKLTSSLFALSPDRPDTEKNFFDLFDSIPLAELKELKNENDQSPFGDIYALMESRTKELNRNYTVTKLSQQLTSLINGKEKGISPEEKDLFLKAAVASLTIDTEHEGIQDAAFDTLYRIDPNIITDSKSQTITKARKPNGQTIFDSILEKARDYLTPKRAAQIALEGVLVVAATGCGPKAPVSAVEVFSKENIPKIVLDSGTAAIGFSTVPAEQPPPESPTPPATATSTPRPTETETKKPTEIKPSLTPSPVLFPTEESLFPPTPEEGVRAVNCNLKVMKERIDVINKARKTYVPPDGRIIQIEQVFTRFNPKTNGNCIGGNRTYLEPEFTGTIQDEVVADPNVEKNWDPNNPSYGEYGDIMIKCKETAKSIFKLFPTSMKLAYDKILELVYDKADKQCEWKLNDNPDYVAPTPTKTPRPTWTQESTPTP